MHSTYNTKIIYALTCFSLYCWPSSGSSCFGTCSLCFNLYGRDSTCDI